MLEVIEKGRKERGTGDQGPSAGGKPSEGEGEEGGDRGVDQVHGPAVTDRWGRGRKERGRSIGPGAWTTREGGAHRRRVPIPRAGTDGGLACGTRASVTQGRRENSENGKMEFDCRYTCLKITFLNRLEAEFKNTPIG